MRQRRLVWRSTPLVARQYDLCRNPDRASRGRVPFLIVLQSDLLEPLETVIVAPAIVEKASTAISRLNPTLALDGKRYRVLMQEMAGVPRSRLGEAVGNFSRQHAEFIAAVNLLFSGI